MAYSLVGSVGNYNESGGSSLSATATISFLAGDLIVGWASWEDQAVVGPTIDDTDSANALTMLTPVYTDNSNYGIFGWLVAASDKSNVTFRMNTPGSPGYRFFCLTILRPDAGTVSIVAEPSHAAGSSTNPTSGQISPEGTNMAIFGAAKNYNWRTYSSPLVAGGAADGIIVEGPAGSTEAALWYKTFTENQSGIDADVTIATGASQYIASILAFNTAAAGGGLAMAVAMHHYRMMRNN